jgi:integrase
MGRPKKQILKKRKDGRYACRYKDVWFYSTVSSEDALAQRDAYKRSLKTDEDYNNTVTVYEYGSKWLKIAYPAVSAATFKGLSIHLQHLVKRLGNVPMRDVKPLQIKEVYSNEYAGASNSYIKAAKQLYSALFDSAVADGICRYNPARATKPHKGTEGGHRAITDRERYWIDHYCHDHRFYPVVATMLYAGIRPQEAKAMRIEKSLDAENEILHVLETAHRDGNNQYKITEQGKTKNAIRDIPAFQPVLEALKGKKGLLIQSARGRQITATTWRNAYDSYVTCMETAINGCHKRWYRKTKEHKKIIAEAEELRKAGKEEEAKAKEAEIPPWIDFTVVPYDLRHSYATWLRDLGVELHCAIMWMGHADAKMIMKIYDEVRENRTKTEAKKVKKIAFSSQIGSQNETESP